MSSGGGEPQFDPVTRDFLLQSHAELKQRCRPGSLLEFASLGQTVPWLYRLSFRTRGLARTRGGEIQTLERHVIALRFLPDYLRHADRFEMLRYLEPREPAPWHPNICPHSGAICIEVYAGESLVEIAEFTHDLLRWRLRQLAEHDALNKEACAYGRDFVKQPTDERPLFGSGWTSQIQLETVERA
jgi:hypothetical protein